MASSDRTGGLERALAVLCGVLLVTLTSCSFTDTDTDTDTDVHANGSHEVGRDQVGDDESDGETDIGDRADPALVDDRQASVGEVSVDEVSDALPTEAELEEIVDELDEQGFCDPGDVEREGIVTAMHFVVRGMIQTPCYAETADDPDAILDGDPRLVVAWEVLTSMAPQEFLADISLVAGYEPCSSCDTLAFVSALDEQASFFVLAVDVVTAEADPEELRLTLMHELTHVFAQSPGDQLDVTSSPEGCVTFYNGVGCFRSDSYIWAWIQEFWRPEMLDTLPVDGSVGDDDEAVERCRIDPAYTGSYAAVHPEEDFAESFSAYVLDVEGDPALLPKFAFFDRYPELVAIRENARALGYSGTEAEFEGCGP